MKGLVLACGERFSLGVRWGAADGLGLNIVGLLKARFRFGIWVRNCRTIDNWEHRYVTLSEVPFKS